MKVHIDDSMTVSEVQNEFIKVFKYIKIEFFTKAHETGESSTKKDLIDHSKKIGEIRTNHTEGDLIINKDMLVSDVESAFEQDFGIHAQIFRKQNNVWLITTSTDNWTLAKQIETAEFMETPIEE